MTCAVASSCCATVNCANWYYPHWARTHYAENTLNTGGAQQTDDTIIENFNKTVQATKGYVFQGGRRSSSDTYEVRMQVEDRDEEGNGLGTYSIKKYKKKAPVADFEAVQRRCAIGKRIMRRQPVPRRKSGKMRATVALKSEERKGWVEAVGGALKEVKSRVEPVNNS